jgi:hypothetical protein
MTGDLGRRLRQRYLSPPERVILMLSVLTTSLLFAVDVLEVHL